MRNLTVYYYVEGGYNLTLKAHENDLLLTRN